MKKLFLTLSLIASTASLQAAAVSITNADFELSSGALPADNNWNNNDPAGWTANGSVGMQDIDNTVGVTNYAIFMQGGTGNVVQDISGATVLGGSIAIGDTFSLSLQARNTNNSPTIDFDIQDSGGNSLIGGFQVSSNAGVGSFITTTASGTVDTASTEIFLMLRTNGPQVMIDDVTLDYVAVPEPSSTALLGLGGLALILRRRK